MSTNLSDLKGVKTAIVEVGLTTRVESNQLKTKVTIEPGGS